MATDPVLLQHLKNITDGVSDLSKKLDDHTADTRRLFEKHEDEIDAIKLGRATEAGERITEAKHQRKQNTIIAAALSVTIPAVIEFFFGGHR